MNRVTPLATILCLLSVGCSESMNNRLHGRNIAGLVDADTNVTLQMERSSISESPCFKHHDGYEHENSNRFFADLPACESHYSDNIVLRTKDGHKTAYLKSFKWDFPGVGWGTEEPAKLRIEDDTKKQRITVTTGWLGLYDISEDGTKVLYSRGGWFCLLDTATSQQRSFFRQEAETYDYIGNDPLRRVIYAIHSAHFCDDDRSVCFATVRTSTGVMNSYKLDLSQRALIRIAQ